MSDNVVISKAKEDKSPEIEISDSRKEELNEKLKKMGIKAPGYLRDMMDNDMKDIGTCFLE